MSATFVCLAAASSGCTALLGESSDGSGDGTREKALPQCAAPNPGVRVLPRITALQFEGAVERLFDAEVDIGKDFPESQVGTGFRTDADANVVSLDGATGIQLTAEAISVQVTADLESLLGCSPSGSSADPCATGYIESLTAAAYRRTPTETELSRLAGVYDAIVADTSATMAMRSVIEVLLQSPQFLYQVEELPEDALAGDVVRVTGRHLANRLSFLFSNAPPDDTLLALADSGELDEPEIVRSEAERLIDEYGVGPVLEVFFHDWLDTHKLEEIEKSTDAFPQFAKLQPHMEEQLVRFAQDVLDNGGTIRDLLTQSLIPVNAELAAFYGVDAPSEGWQTVDLGDDRRGILALPIFLASHANSVTTSPVKRGTFIREGLLCQELVPPANVNVNLPVSKPGESVRERLATHASDPSCAGCHELIDPPGFALENYDAIGQWRDEEETGAPVDASGELLQAGSASGTFDGPGEMISILAQSELISECFAEQWVRFSLRRHNESQDECSVASVQDATEAADGNFRELLLALTQTDAFLYREIPEAE